MARYRLFHRSFAAVCYAALATTCASRSPHTGATNSRQAPVARDPRCDATLLEHSTVYDSSRVLGLVGRYRFVKVDTVPGWAEFYARYSRGGGTPRQRLFDLWATDSAHRYWRTQWLSHARVPTNRPIVGAIVGADTTGFSADMPQITVDGPTFSSLTIRMDPRIGFDLGNVAFYPISVIGAWGFGGRFHTGSHVVPAGVDGKPLPPAAGYYCAFRVSP